MRNEDTDEAMYSSVVDIQEVYVWKGGCMLQKDAYTVRLTSTLRDEKHREEIIKNQHKEKRRKG